VKSKDDNVMNIAPLGGIRANKNCRTNSESELLVLGIVKAESMFEVMGNRYAVWMIPHFMVSSSPYRTAGVEIDSDDRKIIHAHKKTW